MRIVEAMLQLVTLRVYEACQVVHTAAMCIITCRVCCLSDSNSLVQPLLHTV